MPSAAAAATLHVRRARIHEESSAGAVLVIAAPLEALVIAAPLEAPCRSPAAHVARQPTKEQKGRAVSLL